VNYRRLGRTNLEVSEISLGTVELGMKYGIVLDGEPEQPSEETAAKLLHRALDLGVNFIDTARLYGEAEAIIGRVLKPRRQEFVLASKVPHFAAENLSPPALRTRVCESVEESLRQLQSDVVDVMMIHSVSGAAIQYEDLFGTLEELRARGWLRFLGASVYGVETAIQVIESRYADCIQIAYSALDRRPEQHVLPLALEKDVGVVARSVLLKGVLSPRRHALPEQLSELKSFAGQLEQLCGDLPELAYRYVLASPAVATALVGTNHIEELEKALQYASLGTLPEPVLDQLRMMSISIEDLLNPATWPPL